MGDVGHGIAHRGQAFGLEQAVFHGLVFGNVPHDGGEIEAPEDFGHGKGDAQGEFFAVPAPGGEAPGPAQDVGLPGGQIALQKAGWVSVKGAGTMSFRSWPRASCRE